MSTLKSLLTKINNNKSKVGVVGLGYVGLPLSLSLSEAGLCTMGFDTSLQKIDQIRIGQSYIKHIECGRISNALAGSFSVTNDFTNIAQMDIVIICVPTPLNKYREPDLSYVLSALEAIAPYLRKGMAIILESTTYPGTTDELVLPFIEKTGLTVGRDISLIYSPEREDPGNTKFTTASTPKIVGGHTEECLEVGICLYQKIIKDVVSVSSTKVAELTKLLENIYRSVNIGLVNEMTIIADKMGVDIFEVISAAATKPFGFTPFYPGPGLGGHCIPIDPFYLTWKAREFDIDTKFIELSGQINTNMPFFVVQKLNEALNQNGKALNGSKILLIGVAYKKNIDDTRESPALKVMEILTRASAVVEYSDPYVPTLSGTGNYPFELKSKLLDAASLDDYDAAILLADHDVLDYNTILQNSKLVIDTRGRYSLNNSKVIRA